jgi:hypothetical protein
VSRCRSCSRRLRVNERALCGVCSFNLQRETAEKLRKESSAGPGQPMEVQPHGHAVSSHVVPDAAPNRGPARDVVPATESAMAWRNMALWIAMGGKVGRA